MCTLLFNDYNSIASWTKLLLFSVVPVHVHLLYTIKIRALPGLPVQRWELTLDGLCARIQYSCTVYLSLFFHLLLILLPPPSCSSMPPHLLPAAPTCGVFHVLLVLDSINTNVVVQSRTTLPPPLPSPYTLAKPQKPPTHPTIPRGKTYNSIGKNPHKKYRKKTPKNTKKKGRRGVAHDGVQSFPRIIPFQWCHQERRRRQSPYWFDCWVEGAWRWR